MLKGKEFVSFHYDTLHQVVLECGWILWRVVGEKILEGEEGEREIHLRITNAKLAKLVKEQMAESRAARQENRSMKREFEKLRRR